MDPITQAFELQQQRIRELASFGIKAVSGPFLGSIGFSESEKVLRMLRRLRRIEEMVGKREAS